MTYKPYFDGHIIVSKPTLRYSPDLVITIKTSKFLKTFKYSSLSITVFIDRPNSWGLYDEGVVLHIPKSFDFEPYFSLSGFRNANVYTASRELIDLVTNTYDVEAILKVALSIIPPKLTKPVKPKSLKSIQLDLFGSVQA